MEGSSYWDGAGKGAWAVLRCARYGEIEGAATKRWAIALHQIWAVVSTFWAYAFLHLTRLAKVKNDLQNEWDGSWGTEWQVFATAEATKTFLGELDLIFMWSYAVGLIVLSDLGDRFDATRVLAFSMFLGGLVTIGFAVGGILKFREPTYYAILWGVNGLVQSVGWPCVVAVVGYWCKKGMRGGVIGLWSGNASAGNAIAGPLIAPFVGRSGVGWYWGMTLSGGLLVLAGLATVLTVVTRPEDIGFPTNPDAARDALADPDKAEAEALLNNDPMSDDAESRSTRRRRETSDSGSGSGNDNDNEQPITTLESDEEGHKPIGLLGALLLPGTIILSLCYAFLKAVNYAMFFWLADYITSVLGWDASLADNYSTLYDVGGIVGGFVTGLATDYFSRRSPIVFVCLVLAVPLQVVFGLPHQTHASIASLSVVLGVLTGGAANLISSIFAVEVGEEAMKDGKTVALATVAGVVDGIASFGAGGALYAVGALPWSDLTYLLAPLAAGAALLLAPVTYKDLRIMLRWDKPPGAGPAPQQTLQH